MPMAGLDCYVMAVPDGRTAEEAAAELSHDPGVEWAEPMNTYTAQGTASPAPVADNDPLYRVQPDAQEWRLDALHRLATGRNIRVAIIDSAIDRYHPDLAGQVTISENFVAGPAPAAESHGTGVAGIIAALAGNGKGIVGVAPHARLMGLRACKQGDTATHLRQPQSGQGALLRHREQRPDHQYEPERAGRPAAWAAARRGRGTWHHHRRRLRSGLAGRRLSGVAQRCGGGGRRRLRGDRRRHIRRAGPRHSNHPAARRLVFCQRQFVCRRPCQRPVRPAARTQSPAPSPARPWPRWPAATISILPHLAACVHRRARRARRDAEGAAVNVGAADAHPVCGLPDAGRPDSRSRPRPTGRQRHD
ncbi:MAG: S8 family serine peptidase [Asticcacaulis sp.]